MEAPHTPDVEANPQEPPGGTWTEPSGARRRAVAGPRSTTHDMVLPERRSARTATGAARRGAAQRGHLPAARPAVLPGGQETPGPGFRCYGSGWGAAAAQTQSAEGSPQPGPRGSARAERRQHEPLRGVSSPRKVRAGGAAALPPGNIAQGAPHPTPPQPPHQGSGKRGFTARPGDRWRGQGAGPGP